MELFKVVTIEETKKLIEGNFEKIILSEKVALSECTGRILYKDIISGVNIPGFRRSTVDGYAVRSADVAGASDAIPSILDYKGEVLMGQQPSEKISFPGECIYVPTGGMLPEGADCVVMIEYTDKIDANTVLCSSSAAQGENVVNADEDIAKGEVVIKAGTKLRAYEIGVLASIGYDQVEVFQKIRVGIISTGDEVVDTNVVPKLGQVRDINTHLLHALVLESGGEPVIYGVVGDDYEDLKRRAQLAYQQCHIVLISGGSSVGKKDQTLKVMEALEDSKILVHGIAVKPGKPTIITKVGEKIVFGLPGHPLACAVIFKIIVKHYMDTMLGFKDIEYPTTCILNSNYHKAKGREEYLPVVLAYEGNQLIASPIFGKAGLMTGFSKAWGYVKIDKNIEGLKAGEKVSAFRF